MKSILAALLALFSTHALASSCDGPAWEFLFQATPTTVEVGSPVHFTGFAMPHPVSCGTISGPFRDISFNFGDGQSFDSQSFALVEVDHTYAAGNFLAVITITAGVASWEMSTPGFGEFHGPYRRDILPLVRHSGNSRAHHLRDAAGRSWLVGIHGAAQSFGEGPLIMRYLISPPESVHPIPPSLVLTRSQRIRDTLRAGHDSAPDQSISCLTFALLARCSRLSQRPQLTTS
jgi:hypothetical protein